MLSPRVRSPNESVSRERSHADFLLTLADLGYVATDGKYFRLTARVLDLGYAYLSSMPLSRMATEFLEEVTEQTKESSSASVLDGQDIIYVARVPTRHILSITLSIGTRLPAYCTSMGRVLLAALPKPELQRYLEQVQLRPRTPNTVHTRNKSSDVKGVPADTASWRRASRLTPGSRKRVGVRNKRTAYRRLQGFQ
jgi:DNA-binding IclR family transcriptional regulator